MAESEGKELKAREKAELKTSAEQTRPGHLFSPAVDIFETEKGMTLLADIPGVRADDLSIDLRDDILTLSGDVKSPESPDEVDVLREYRTGQYLREFALSEVIDQGKIEAKLKDGVLRLNLPKVEKAAPRKITVKTD
jgi:HSP20 family molecular chaperone IbpA